MHVTAATLGSARYLALVTYRRDGRGVQTTVWPVALDDRLFFGTTRDTGKVKRLRNDPRVRVAPGNARGTELLGDWREGRAHAVDDAHIRQRIGETMRRKYGWQYHLVMLLYRLRGIHGKRVVYEIELPPEATS